jgi:YVTN family beta-propeller protein
MKENTCNLFKSDPSPLMLNPGRFLMISPPKGYLIFLLSFLIAGCLSEGAPSKYKAPLGDAGEVSLFLQPMPQGSEKLRFSLAQISALREDGQEFFLSLAFDELSGAELTGVQKNLAAGILPPGRYTGLTIRVAKAFVQTQDGEIALLVPEQPLAVEHGFDVRRKSVAALFLALQGSKFITAEFRFTPVFSLASPGRGLISLTGFVSNSGSNTLTVFDKKAMRVVDAIATSQGPGGIVLDQTRARAYVAAARDDAIEVIDVFKREIINRLRLNFMDRPVELALSPDGRTLVSVNQASNTVSIIDAVSMTEVRKIQVGDGPASAVVDPAGLKVYVMNTRSSTISVVDLTQRALAVTISVEAPPLRGAFNRRGSALYVISSESPNLLEIDPARLIVRKKIFIGMGAVSLAVDHPTGQIYVGKKIGGDIAVIDPFSSMFVDTVQLDGTAVSLTIDGEERSLLAALADRRKLQKINLISKKTVAEIEVSEGAFTVVVMGER